MNKKPRAPRNQTRSDDGRAFLPDPYARSHPPAHTNEPVAEELAEEFVRSATSAEEAGTEARDELVPEEAGGPFIETSATREFADGIDPSNPADAERAPFPTATRTRG